MGATGPGAIGVDSADCADGIFVAELWTRGSVSPNIIAGGTAGRSSLSFGAGGGGVWSFAGAGCEDEELLTGAALC